MNRSTVSRSERPSSGCNTITDGGTDRRPGHHHFWDRDGSYQVRVQHPSLARTTGAVSIRTEVWDVDGNRVTQQLDRAYGLSAARSHGRFGAIN